MRGGGGRALPHFYRTCCIAKCSEPQILNPKNPQIPQPLPAQGVQEGANPTPGSPRSLDFHLPTRERFWGLARSQLEEKLRTWDAVLQGCWTRPWRSGSPSAPAQGPEPNPGGVRAPPAVPGPAPGLGLAFGVGKGLWKDFWSWSRGMRSGTRTGRGSKPRDCGSGRDG